MELPLRYQGTLLTGIRGCDLTPKPAMAADDPPERALVAFLRFCVMNPADPREIGMAGAFFCGVPPKPEAWKPSQLGHYPLHWVAHIMHCFEIIGYCNPDVRIRFEAYSIYRRLVDSLHLNCETQQQLHARLTEDRVASGTVVS